MASRPIIIFSLFAIVFQSQPVISQTWQERFDEVESLLERQQADSAGNVLEQTVTQAETRFGQSDSTVDVEFFADGVSYRLFYHSFAEAESLYTRLVDINEKLHGSANHEFAVHMRKLGAVYVALGRYREAEAVYRRALAVAEKAYGPDSEKTVVFLNDLGDVLCILAEYGKADSIAQRALRISDDILGHNYLPKARSLQIAGEVLVSRIASDEAEPLLQRSLAIRENHLGPDHPDVAKSLVRLAACYQDIVKQNQAKAALKRSVEMGKVAYGPKHPRVAQNLSELVWYQGGSQREPLAREAYLTLDGTLGPNHPWTAMALLTWANEKRMLASYSEAEANAQQALSVLEEAYGQNHPSVALAYETIAICKLHLSQFADALINLQRAETILTERAIPNIRLATVLDFLFVCYTNMGREAKADSAVAKLETLAEEAGTTRHAAYVSLKLGMIYLQLKRTAEGRDQLNRALDISNNLTADDTTVKIVALRVLAASWMADNEYDKAEDLVCQVLPKLENRFGPKSDVYAVTVDQLGRIYASQGKFDLAKETYLSGLSIYEQSRTFDSREAAQDLFSLGAICGAMGDYDESLAFYTRCSAVKQRMIRVAFGSSSEAQKVKQASRYPVIFDEVFSLAAISETGESRQLALDITLKEKAIVEGAAMVDRQAAYCNYDSTIVNHLDQLENIRTTVANLVVSGSGDSDSLRVLYEVHDSLETELSRNCLEFKDELALRDFEVSDVAASIPKGTVLLELIKYRPVNFDSAYFASGFVGSPDSNYMALTLGTDNEISLTDLGPADAVDSLVSLAREMIYDAQSMMYSARAAMAEEKLNDVTGQLRELVFDPLTEQLDGCTSLYISPDGMLNLLPFEILPLTDSSYLMETYRISYLSSGRDLIRYRQAAEVSEGLVVMADPDFDRSDPTKTDVFTLPAAESEEPSQPLAMMLRGAGGCLNGPMGRLGYSQAEGKHIAESFRERSSGQVTELYGAQASEANLKQMETAPGVLHLATHGYFCPYSEGLSSNYKNPLLRSGLVLAGYNRTIDNESDSATVGEDGILTAYEVSGLNFDGTELVTLSACESGMSEGYTCEGLYGLRRAFQHAGAQSVVMSLWKVPDRETGLLMEGFYDRWLSGNTKQDALRESALDLLRNCREELGCGHPLLWGGFILTGNPN